MNDRLQELVELMDTDDDLVETDNDVDLVAAGYIIKPSGTGKIRSDGKPIEGAPGISFVNSSHGLTDCTAGPRYVCQVCGTAVSMYASSLYVHVKNHINYKPYSCSACDYRTPVKSKARRHVQVCDS